MLSMLNCHHFYSDTKLKIKLTKKRSMDDFKAEFSSPGPLDQLNSSNETHNNTEEREHSSERTENDQNKQPAKDDLIDASLNITSNLSTVASLTSAFEENVQTLMEKYTEEALKSIDGQDKLQLKLDNELNALSQTSSVESTESFMELGVKLKETKTNKSISTFQKLDNEHKLSNFVMEMETVAELNTVKNVVNNSLTQAEKEDPSNFIREIIDHLIPGPIDVHEIVANIVDNIIDNMVMTSPPEMLSSLQTTSRLLGSGTSPPMLDPLPSKRVRGKIYPPIFPPPGRPGRITNRLEYMRKKVLPAMFNHKDAWPFKTPVDSIKLNIPDYHNIVKNPMDLGTIKKRLTNRYYWNAEECKKDFKLMFHNCYMYNKPDYDIVLMCKELEKAYDKKIQLMHSFSNLDEESEGIFSVPKRKKNMLKSDYSNVPVKKRPHLIKKRASMYPDYESEIPLAQVAMPYHLSKKLKRANIEESSSAESDEESVTDSEEDLPAFARSHPVIKNYPPSLSPNSTVSAATPAKPTEKKQKHLCKYCEQPFLSRTVRDMHEKHKHQLIGLGPMGPEPKPHQVTKKVPPLKVSLKKNSLQIVPVKPDSEQNRPEQPLGSAQHSVKPLTGLPMLPGRTSRTVASSLPSAVNSISQAQFQESDILNFVDKKHRAVSMSKQRQQNSQAGNKHGRSVQLNFNLNKNTILFDYNNKVLYFREQMSWVIMKRNTKLVKNV